MPKGNLLTERCAKGERQVCQKSKCVTKDKSDQYRIKQKLRTSLIRGSRQGATKRQRKHKVGGLITHGRTGRVPLRWKANTELLRTQQKHGLGVRRALQKRLANSMKASSKSNERVLGNRHEPAESMLNFPI